MACSGAASDVVLCRRGNQLHRTADLSARQSITGLRLDAVEANEAAIRTSAGSGPLLLEMPVYRLSGAAR